MTSTLGFTGMDRATQADLSEAIGQSIQRLGLDLRLVDGGDADVVMVDMDSLYGPMSWMQLHNAGRKVIGYTSSARSQTDYLLARPYNAHTIDLLLGELGALPAAAPAAPKVDATAPHAEPHAAVPHGFTEAPAPMDILPEEVAVATIDEERVPPAPEPVMEAVPVQEPEPEPEPEPVPLRDPVLADWLHPGSLPLRVRFQRGAGPALYIDGLARQYHGPTTLKPLADYFEGTVTETDFTPLNDAAWQRDTAAAGDAQPLSRLVWFAGLLEGRGSLLPQVDPEGRYRLTKWLQTEREYPKHFRIATAMMKGPAMVTEIAAAANVSDAEVADFVNAGLATGIVAQDIPEAPPAPEPARGLFGIKRNR